MALGRYSEFFGAPEFKVCQENGKISGIEVVRGAPCGATWDAAKRLEGLRVEEALARSGLEVQFFCSADPASWDPLYGKSPVHFAGEIHKSAFSRALRGD